MVPNKTRIIAEQDTVIIVTYYVTMATGKPCKNTLVGEENKGGCFLKGTSTSTKK